MDNTRSGNIYLKGYVPVVPVSVVCCTEPL